LVAAGGGRLEVDPTAAARHGGLLGRIGRGSRELNRDPERPKRLWFHSSIWALFLLVPTFALLLRVVFRSAGVHYPGHLVFALHPHGVGLLVGAELLLLAMVPRSRRCWLSACWLACLCAQPGQPSSRPIRSR